jgi:hypothetical protein
MNISKELRDIKLNQQHHKNKIIELNNKLNPSAVTIEQVNLCLENFKVSTSCVSFVHTMIQTHKDSIIQNGYEILRPLLDKKYSSPGNYCWITSLPPNKNNATDLLQYSNRYGFLQGRRIMNIGDIGPYKAANKNIQKHLIVHANYYYAKLREHKYESLFYDLTILPFVDGPQLQINIFMKDVRSSNFIVIGSPIELSSLLKPIPLQFNRFVSILANTLNSTGNQNIFQYGSDFSTLKCISSTNPKWVGQLIKNCFGDTNENIPLIYETLNTGLLSEPRLEYQKCFVTYQFQEESYVAVIEILPDYKYVQTSLRLSDIFKPTTRSNDEIVRGSLKICDKDTAIVNIDPSTRITCFHEKVGINQSAFEVNAILDIDTNTQEQIILINSTIKSSLSKLHDIVNKNEETVYDFIMSEQFNNITIFKAPIKINIVKNDIEFINGALQFNDESVKKLRTLIHEINYVTKSTKIYTFIENFNSDNINYLTAMVGIIQNGNMIFFAIPTDIDYIMKDLSLSKRFSEVISTYSELNRSLNYAVTLLENEDIQTDLLAGKSTSFTNAIDSSPDNIPMIKRRGYFFCFSYEDLNESTYLFHEKYKYWANEQIRYLSIAGISVMDVLGVMQKQYVSNYDSSMMQTGLIDYMWTNGLKCTFVHKVVIEDTVYMLCVGMDLMETLVASLNCRGDSTLSGNFTITDDANNIIFHIDNYDKCVKNMYNMGIGTPFPKSPLDIQDCGMSDIIHLINDISSNDKYTNYLLTQLRTIDMTNLDAVTEVFDTLNTVPGFEDFVQTKDKYYTITTLATDNSADSSWCYFWLNPEFAGKSMDQLETDYPDYSELITTSKSIYDVLWSSYSFDGSLKLHKYNWIRGLKSTGYFFYMNNGATYILDTGKNTHGYNLKMNTNTNIQNFFKCMYAFSYYLQRLIVRYTNVQGQKNMTVLDDLITKSQRTYPMTTYTVYNLEETTVDIYDFSTHALISSTLIINMDYNAKIKSLSFVNYYNVYYSSMNQGYGMLHFEDSLVNYVSQFYIYDGKIYSVEYVIENTIHPTLIVQGDSQIQGNLIVYDKYNDVQYTTIDPGIKYVGINTDERTILYNTEYDTTNKLGDYAQHHVYIKSAMYPNVVCERQNETETGFTNFSACTVKRKSEVYTFQEMLDGSKLDTSYGAPDQSMYGVDMSFEISDKTNTTHEIGNILMGIESIDPNGHIKAGFGVDVYDDNLQPRRILTVDNSGSLSVNSIKIGDHSIKLDETGLLKMPSANCTITTINNRQTLETHYPFAIMNSTEDTVEHVYKCHLPVTEEPIIVFSLSFNMEYTEYMLDETDDITNPASYFFKTSFTYDTTWINTGKKIPTMPCTPKRYPCEETDLLPVISFKFDYIDNSVHLYVILPSNTYIVGSSTIVLGQIYPRHKTLYDSFNFNIEKL